jgi:peptidoglycan/LPS O-acetylase OafA/YrhL
VTPQPPGGDVTRLAYQPGLDGLRALAVGAVLLYHFGVSWLPGGFLGVEVFFVISGYLITSLLFAEWRSTHGITLRSFWARRARRLLPALFAMLVIVSAAALLFAPDAVAELRRGVLAATAYVTNWYEIVDKQSYFARFGRPPVLLHLWSLAVEEQFYLIWPPLLLLGLHLSRGRRRPLLKGALAGAAASALAGFLLYHPGVDPSRVYYGTDTRASGLLLGSALALVWAPSRLIGTIRTDARLVLEAVGGAALVGLLWVMWRANEFDPFVYRGGFLLVDVLTLGVIAVAVHPAPALGRRVLGWAPLRWVGQRSYGIYLWHWPVYAMTRPGPDVPISGWLLVAVRLGLTVGLAELSYVYVELPIRHGALGRWWRSLQDARARRARLPRRWVAGWSAVAGALSLVAVGLVVARPTAQPVSSSLSVSSGPATTAPAPAPAATTTTVVTSIASLGTRPATTATTAALAAPTTASPATTVTTAPPAPLPAVTAVGDSVMLGAAAALQARIPGIAVNSAIGRQFPAATALVQQLRLAHQLGQEVILHLGTNGPMTDGQFDALMSQLTGVQRVLVVNTRVDQPWQDLVNGRLAAGVRRWPNAVLVDWHAASAGHAGLFWSDGTHLRPAGAQFYANLLASYLAPPVP